MSTYDDIITTEWPQESLRPKMPLNQRAKIFLPFSALTGYDKALQETLNTEVAEMEVKTGSIVFYEEE